jgi:hypothetical protein
MENGATKKCDGKVSVMLSEGYIKKVRENSKPLTQFKKGTIIRGNTAMNPHRKKYEYVLAENPGEGFSPEFKPALAPGEMLALGAFEGKYINDSYEEFPAEWFLHAAMLGKLSSTPDPSINFFGIKSRQPLSVWKRNGWAPCRGRAPCEPRSEKKSCKDETNKCGEGLLGGAENPDERGWFQWYCRYWIGRRIPEIDKLQIGRWKAFARHAGQIKANCKPGDLSCRPKQRQALLQWSYNPYI